MCIFSDHPVYGYTSNQVLNRGISQNFLREPSRSTYSLSNSHTKKYKKTHTKYAQTYDQYTKHARIQAYTQTHTYTHMHKVNDTHTITLLPCTLMHLPINLFVHPSIHLSIFICFLFCFVCCWWYYNESIFSPNYRIH